MKASLLLSAIIMASSALGAPKIVTKTAVVYVTEEGPAATVKGAPTPCPDKKPVHTVKAAAPKPPVYTTIKAAAPKPPVYAAPKPVPKPTPQPAPKPAAPSGDMAQSCVQSHNELRSKHAAPPLTWDEELVYTSEISASNCRTSVHNAQGNGENRASVSGQSISKPNAGDMVRNQWYSNELDAYMRNPGTFSMAAGHLTQVLWKSTSRVGCALRYCSQIDGGLPGYLLVCQYQTPGNYAGEFEKNVQV